MGWQCPNCLIVYAPDIKECWCSSVSKEPTVSLSGGSIVGVGGIGYTNNITRSTSDSTTINICSGYVSETGDGICTKCAKPKWNHLNVSYT